MFLITYTPTKAVETACKARGMKEGDGTSFWDWVQSEHFEKHVTRRSWVGAVEAAKRALPFDCFGEVQISRLQRMDEDYGPDRWEANAYWYVQPDEIPDLAKPDYEPELLSED